MEVKIKVNRKFSVPNKKCWHYKNERHIRKHCLERNKADNHNKTDINDSACASDGYDSAEVLVTSSSSSENKRVLDSGVSFHMISNNYIEVFYKFGEDNKKM